MKFEEKLTVAIGGNLFKYPERGDCTLSICTGKTNYHAFLFDRTFVQPYIGGVIREQDKQTFITTLKELIKELETGLTAEERSAKVLKEYLENKNETNTI